MIKLATEASDAPQLKGKRSHEKLDFGDHSAAGYDNREAVG